MSTSSYAVSAAGIKTEERIALSFFVYLAVLGFVRGLPLQQQSLLLATPIALAALWIVEGARSTPTSRVARQWFSLGLILAGYWSIGLFQSEPRADWQLAWVELDRTLLDGFALRTVVESAGSLIPSLLESTYLLLYAIPPLSLGALYLGGRRASAGRYLQVLFLGTFTAYALLPLFPVTSPRIAFPDVDLPQLQGLARPLNTWILDHLDISISVFPSGHVAVAFSSAFGLFTVLKHKPRICAAAFCAAFTVYLATVYGRYHYALDGLASITIAILAWAATSWRARTSSDSR